MIFGVEFKKENSEYFKYFEAEFGTVREINDPNLNQINSSKETEIENYLINRISFFLYTLIKLTAVKRISTFFSLLGFPK